MRAEEAALRGRTAADAWLVPPVRIAGVMRHSGGEGGQPLSHLTLAVPPLTVAASDHQLAALIQLSVAQKRHKLHAAYLLHKPPKLGRPRRGVGARPLAGGGAGGGDATRRQAAAAAARDARAEGALHVPHRPDGACVARRRGRRRRRARARRQGARAPLGGGARRAAQVGGLAGRAAARVVAAARRDQGARETGGGGDEGKKKKERSGIFGRIGGRQHKKAPTSGWTTSRPRSSRRQCRRRRRGRRRSSRGRRRGTSTRSPPSRSSASLCGCARWAVRPTRCGSNWAGSR